MGIAGLIAAASVCAQQSINLKMPSAVIAVPAAPPFNSLMSFRLDGRIHNWTIDAARRNIVNFSAANNFHVAIYNGSLFLTDGYDNQSLQIALAGYSSDVIWRFNRDTSVKQVTLEMWNANGSNYNIAAASITATAATAINLTPAAWVLGDPDFALNTFLAYLRMYSTVSGPSNVPDAPLVAGGNLLDYEFDGNGNDASPNHLNWGLVQSNFTQTPRYGPAAVVSSLPITVRAGGAPITLDASRSYSLGPSSSLRFVWNQSGGPRFGAAPWSGQNTPVARFRAPIAGEYQFALEVTDSGGSVTRQTFTVGAVATDDNGVVVTSNPAIDAILGPMIRYGANPWSWADERHMFMANAVGNSLDVYWPAFWDTPSAGTVDATNGIPAIVGHGTHFTTELCQGPGSPSIPKPGAFIFVWYSSVDYPGSTGRVAFSVGSCTDDTHLSVTGGLWQYASEAGMQYTILIDPGTGPYTNWTYSNIPANYYDNVMAFYALYYRTGLTKYLNWARTLADRWWRMPKIDRGRPYNVAQENVGSAFFENRNWSLAGLVLRAIDARDPSYWTGLSHFLDFYGGQLRAPLAHNDMRVQGYASRDFALCAQFAQGNPSHPSYYTSGDLKTNCYNSLVQQATGSNGLVSWQDAVNKNWTWLYAPYGTFSGGTTGIGASSMVVVTQGSTVVTRGSGSTSFLSVGVTDPSNGFPVNFLFCNSSNPTSNANCDSREYARASVADDNTLILSTPYQGTSGTKTWAAGSFNLFGTVAYMQGLAGYGFSQASKALVAAGDNTNAAFYSQFSVDVGHWLWNKRRTSTTGIYYARAFVNCEPADNDVPAGSALACSAGSQTTNSRIDVGQTIRGLSEAYLNSGQDPVLRAQNDAFYNALFAKPGFTAPAGFAVDADYIRPLDTASDCDRSQGDCGYMTMLAAGQNYLNSPFSNKWFGFFFGTGGAYTWPAARLGGVAPPRLRTQDVVMRFGTGVTQAVVSVIQPSGGTQQVTCTSSPCQVTVDARLGDHLIRVDYQSSGRTTAPASDYTILKMN